MDLRAAARRAAKKYGLNPNIFERQIGRESNFNPKAISPAGAQGVAQIMPATAEGWGVDPMDPMAALDAAARNMAQYVKKYGGYEAALRAYNAGPGAIEASKGYSETNNYVNSILGGRDPGGLSKPVGGGIPPVSSQPPRMNLFETLGQLETNPMLKQGWDLMSQIQSRRDTPTQSLGRPQGGPIGPIRGGPNKLSELFYDPIGGWDEGKNIGPIGGHEHVHVAGANPRITKRLLKAAQNRFGLTVREHPAFDPVDPVHTEGSLHYNRRAGDVSGDPEQEAAYVNFLRRKFRLK